MSFSPKKKKYHTAFIDNKTNFTKSLNTFKNFKTQEKAILDEKKKLV